MNVIDADIPHNQCNWIIKQIMNVSVLLGINLISTLKVNSYQQNFHN